MILSGFADFTAPYSLTSLARRLSDEVFAGIAFTGENTGIRDECPSVRLEKEFLGFEIVLSGDQEEWFTLELTTVTRGIAPDETQSNLEPHVLDVADFLRSQLLRVEGITLKDPVY